MSVTERPTSPPTDLEITPSKPVAVWAVLGAAVLGFQIFVWVRWISGPYFTRIEPGPTPLGPVMKFFLTMNWVVLWAALPAALWFFIIRPWVRERRITLDGMLFASMGLMFFQDPLLNYFNTWCVYNSWLFNRGAWTSDIPGWMSAEQPGHQSPEPLLTNAPGYAYGVLLCTIVICFFMRRIRSRYPTISNVRLILATYAIAIVFDVVMEGCILLPMGFYSYPGAIRELTVFGGHYYQYPIYEGFMWGAVQAALASLRFFTDDKGRTVVERGLERVRGGAARKQFVRFLAIFGAVSAAFFIGYNVPAQFTAMHASPWPKDVQERSYLSGGVCGDGTLCPDPTVPATTKKSGTITPDGTFVPPDGKKIPTVVPYLTGK